MTEAIGQFGPGLPTPSRYRLSSPCLNAEVSRVKNSLKKHEEEWAISGCSIMTDAWTDRKRRSIMNLCVHCKEGISFISSREDSDASHTGSYIFEYVDKCIDDVGPEKVVQVVTDNASNNMAAATLMASKGPNLFWTSCATHTVNLMLEAIGKLPRFKSAIDKARALTIFIYAHHSTLSMMRKLTKKRDIVRPGVTRFASNYLTLQSLVEKKEQLRIMFASEEWARNSHSKSVKGKVAYATVVSISFWKSVNSCLIVFRPLVRVLRLVDSDRPSMPWLYGELEVAKREIKEEVYSGVEKNYKPIIDIIETRSKGWLDSDLHLAGYMLNPYYFAKNKVEIGEDLACMEAIINCVEKFFSDDMNIQVQVSDEELLMYKNLVGMFGRKQAKLSYQTKGVNDFNPAAEFDVYNSYNIVSCNQPDIDDAVAYENHDAETAVAMIESPRGEESSQSDSWSMDCSPVLRVNSVYISSAILAAKSPFFYKLFSNGMLESDQRHATLRICASEEAALMELLSFMYSGKLSTNSPPLVLDVLMAADKFEVASCMRYCSQLLRSQSMTTESALLYLELPSSVSMASAVQPLTDAAREFLANKFRDITKFQDEVMNLPLVGIEAIVSSDNLQVASEDAVYDFVLKWARIQYPKAEERREILGARLGRLIRFPYMTCRKLKKVLTCNDLDHEISSKAVLEALFFKAETPHRQRALASDDPAANRRYIERSYKYRPVKVVEFEVPHPQCIVYLDLKKEECANLFPGGRVYSQAFHLGGQGFFLSAHCNMDQQSSFHCFGLFLGMQEKGSVTFTVDYEFAARTKPAGDFVSKYKGYYTFTGGKAVGYRNLFATPWTSFTADDSLYFINGILHLRAELTIKQLHPTAALPAPPLGT